MKLTNNEKRAMALIQSLKAKNYGLHMSCQVAQEIHELELTLSEILSHNHLQPKPHTNPNPEWQIPRIFQYFKNIFLHLFTRFF